MLRRSNADDVGDGKDKPPDVARRPLLSERLKVGAVEDSHATEPPADGVVVVEVIDSEFDYFHDFILREHPRRYLESVGIVVSEDRVVDDGSRNDVVIHLDYRMQPSAIKRVAAEDFHHEILEVFPGEKRHHQLYDAGGLIYINRPGDEPLKRDQANAYRLNLVTASKLIDCSVQIASVILKLPDDAARNGVGIWT